MGLLPRVKASELLTRREAARYLGVSTSTLDRWRRQGLIKARWSPSGQPRFFLLDLDKAFS